MTLKPRREHAEIVVEGLEEERRALAERYTIDAEEARRREQLAAEAAERDAERLAVTRAAENEARRAALATRRAEREHQADHDLQARLDVQVERAHRPPSGADAPPTSEYAPDVDSPLEYGGGMLLDDSPNRQIERVRELSKIGDLLVEIADAIRAKEGPVGVLPHQLEASRLPILRGRLAIALAAARVLGASDLEACRKVVETPPNFTRQARPSGNRRGARHADLLAGHLGTAAQHDRTPPAGPSEADGVEQEEEEKEEPTATDHAEACNPGLDRGECPVDVGGRARNVHVRAEEAQLE
jgi:hypothetical protein